MTVLEELKKQRRELDAKIKEMEGGRYIRCGSVRYEHRKYPTAKIEEIVAVNKPRELRGHSYSEWWNNVISAPTKTELMEKLQGTIADMQQLLVLMNEEADAK